MYKRLRKAIVDAVLRKKGECKLIERQDKLGVRDNKREKNCQKEYFLLQAILRPHFTILVVSIIFKKLPVWYKIYKSFPAFLMDSCKQYN